MSSSLLCPECGEVRTFSYLEREETYEFRGESITLGHQIAVCTVCSAEVSTANQMKNSLDAVREEYRRRHDLVAPDEIRAIRGRYGAGQKPFAVLLGFGEGTIACYENGDVPTAAHSSLIRAAGDPVVFRKLFGERRHLIGPTQQKRIEAALKNEPVGYQIDVEALAVREEPDEYTGFRRPELRRMEQLLGLVALTAGADIVKTKLLKIAFLCEYEFFREYTVSITGWPYARLPYGPVPQEYKQILDVAERDGYLESQDFDDGRVVFRAGPASTGLPGDGQFSDHEVRVVQEVVSRWKGETATVLSEYTHTLPAWKETKHAREISYARALES